MSRVTDGNRDSMDIARPLGRKPIVHWNERLVPGSVSPGIVLTRKVFDKLPAPARTVPASLIGSNVAVLLGFLKTPLV